jgi:hypothetical protein
LSWNPRFINSQVTTPKSIQTKQNGIFEAGAKN